MDVPLIVAVTCTCTTCGNNVQESPIEACDGTDDSSGPGVCVPAGNPNQCTCAVCGNDIAEVPLEDCDGFDDVACPGMCSITCTCP
jgi:hypothetical protein